MRSSSAQATRSPLVVWDTTSDSGPNSHRTWRHPPHGGVGRAASVTTAMQSILRSPAAAAAATSSSICSFGGLPSGRSSGARLFCLMGLARDQHLGDPPPVHLLRLEHEVLVRDLLALLGYGAEQPE